MKLLVVGHSLVVDANRKFWNVFARNNKSAVDLICPRTWSSNLSKELSYSSNSETDSNLKIFPLPVFFKGRGSLFFFHPLETLQVLNQKKYDALFLNQETWAFSTLIFVLVKLISQNRRTPLHLCVAQNIPKSKYKWLHPYERFISKFISSFFYCSEGVKEVLRWKGINKPAHYLPLPFDDESSKPIEYETQKSFTLGYLGRLTENKGITLLLKTLDELQQEGFSFQLIVGGAGPLANELKKKTYVTYLGLIPHNNGHEFYQKIDCFILPSQTKTHWKEQFGRVIVESFGMGKPVIGSSSGSIPEVLDKLQWPWVFEEKSVEDLKNKIRKMKTFLESSEGRSQLKRSVGLNYQLFSQSEVSKKLARQLEESH
jgi:glycosyltransferase involved in cell wall biosynthesis